MKKKIFYFAKYSDVGPSSRERIYCYYESLKKSGFEVQINYLLADYYFNYINTADKTFFNKIKLLFYLICRYFNRIIDLIKARKYDVIIIEQELFPYFNFYIEKFFIKYFLSFNSKKIGVEFDDAVYLTGHKRLKIPALLKLADFAITGNKNLKVYAEKFNSKTFELPTGVDITVAKSIQKNENITIGWTGLAYNLKYFESIKDVLCKLQQKYKIDVIIVCNKKPLLDNLKFRFIEWSQSAEHAAIEQFDIGVMPLNNDEWCAGKCGYKLLRYMAAGISSVASPVGVNAEIIDNKENGLLALTPEEWYDNLKLLIEDAALREKLGNNARLTIEKKYSKKIVFEKLKNILNEI